MGARVFLSNAAAGSKHRSEPVSDIANSSSISRPAIAVVCPTFNSATFFEKTLATVLGQTRKPDLLVISDDGSSDGTVDHVQRYLEQHANGVRFQVLANGHGGPGAARNAGIRVADCEWIAFLDSDDRWMPRKLERMERAILEWPDANFFSHDEVRLSREGRTTPLRYGRNYCRDLPLPPQLYFSNMFSTSAVTCRRNLLLRHGGFDETLMSAQDYELWLRMSSEIEPVFLNEVLGQYVERGGNITSGKLSRRMYNELLIAWKHRGMVSAARMSVRIGRIALSYGWQLFATRRA